MKRHLDAGCTAEIILQRGAIVTMDARMPRAEALAIAGERIIAVGGETAVSACAGPCTRTIDLRGRTVIPGLIDAHAHLDREGLKTLFPSLAGVRNLRDLQHLLTVEARRRPAGSWIVTMPLGEPPHYFDPLHRLAERRWPTRWDLDAAAPDHPVYIRAPFGFWGEPPLISIANSRALKLCGVTADSTPPLSTITIERDARGEPTGVFRENHLLNVVELTLMGRVPRFSLSDRVEGLRRSLAHYAGMGITTAYEGHGAAPEILAAYRSLRKEGPLGVRCHLVRSPWWGMGEDAERRVREAAVPPNVAEDGEAQAPGDPWLGVGDVFLPFGGNAELAAVVGEQRPYTGWAGYDLRTMDEQEYVACAEAAMRHGLRVHTIDGWRVDRILELWEPLIVRSASQRRRHVLVHLRRASNETLRRLKALGVVVTTIPSTVVWKEGARYLDQPPAQQEIAPHRSLLNAGIPVALATDNCPANPFAIMWAAVTRRERTTGRTLGAGQRMTHSEALHAMTVDGAYLCGMEKSLGSLTPGKYADLVILENDLLTIPSDNLPEVRPVLTMAGGRVTSAMPQSDLAAALERSSP